MAHVAHVVRNLMNSGLYPSPRHHGSLNGLALSLGTTNSLRADTPLRKSHALGLSTGLFLCLSLRSLSRSLSQSERLF